MLAPEATEDVAILNSPLIECGEAAILPGVVALDAGQLWNDTAILTKSPLTLRLPQQQWSYGFVVPLNHDAVPSRSRSLVVRINLTVRGGAVGLAGVNETRQALTTKEQFIGEGTHTVTLTISDPALTSAILIRTASEVHTPEVSLLEFSVHRAGAIRLVRRRHDLGHDLFVVLSPPKTATHTIERTLQALDPAIQTRRTHYISLKRAALHRNLVHAGTMTALGKETLLSGASFADDVRREIEQVRRLGGRVALIVGMRDPIARSVALCFQRIPNLIPGFVEFRAVCSSGLLNLLSEFIVSLLQRNAELGPDMSRFFSDELTPLGIEVTHRPFDRKQRFSLITGPDISTLIYRVEDMHWSVAPALCALTGRGDIEISNANLSEYKEYAELYREFRSSFRVPAELCSLIYDKDPYLRHFYSEVEIAAFKAKWCA